jgi:hypothetical protein
LAASAASLEAIAASSSAVALSAARRIGSTFSLMSLYCQNPGTGARARQVRVAVR